MTISDEYSFYSTDKEHKYQEIFDRQFTDFKVKKMKEKEEEHDVDHRFHSHELSE